MNRSSMPWYGYVLFVMVALLVMLIDEIKDTVWVFVFVAAIFVFAFALLLGLSVKLWKQSDSEILKDIPSLSGLFSDIPDSSPALSLAHLGICSAVMVIYMLKAEGKPFPVYIICAFVWILLAARVVRSFLLRRKSKSRTPYIPCLQVSSQQAIAFLVGTVASGFLIFIGTVGTIHGVWWFILPPVLIILSIPARLVVAAVRSFCTENFPKKEVLHRDDLPLSSQDPGEKHLRREQHRDPWDRPDKTY